MPLVPWLSKILRDTPMENIARRTFIRVMPGKPYQYERDVLRIIKRGLSRDSNAVDIGAFRGGVLAEIVRYAPQGLHYAFEPLPEHYRYLMRTFPGVRVFPYAISDATDQAACFYHVINRPTISGLQEQKAFTLHEPVATVQVETHPLDDIIPYDHSINFIKIDVEGAEYQVICGAQNTIRRCKPVVLFEHGPASEWYYQHPSAELHDLLVDVCKLKLNTLRGWLHNQPALDRQEFLDLTKIGKNTILWLTPKFPKLS